MGKAATVETDPSAAIGPDERALVADLEDVRFLSGVDNSYWRLVGRDKTVVTFELTARTGRRIGVQLDCAGYPGVAPTGRLWSTADDIPLPVDQWPTGGRCAEVFNPMISARGHIAIIAPKYGRPARIDECGVHTYLGSHRWVRVAQRDVHRTIRVYGPFSRDQVSAICDALRRAVHKLQTRSVR